MLLLSFFSLFSYIFSKKVFVSVILPDFSLPLQPEITETYDKPSHRHRSSTSYLYGRHHRNGS